MHNVIYEYIQHIEATWLEFADDISKSIFSTETYCISVQISQTFVPMAPSFAQIMSVTKFRRGKPLSEPMMA